MLRPVFLRYQRRVHLHGLAELVTSRKLCCEAVSRVVLGIFTDYGVVDLNLLDIRLVPKFCIFFYFASVTCLNVVSG